MMVLLFKNQSIGWALLAVKPAAESLFAVR
jgi:hypothetical protein